MKIGVCIFTVLAASSAFGSDIEARALTALLKNPNRTVKNHCELGSGQTVRVSTFVESYIRWTFQAEKIETRFLRCKKIDGKKRTHQCDFKYAEKGDGVARPGWDVDLEFVFSEGKGIDWDSVQCVSTP